MPQGLLDDVFKKTKPRGDPAGPSASRGGKAKNGKVVSKRQSSSQGRRCSLDGYVVQSTSQYDAQVAQSGQVDVVHKAAESWNAFGSLRNGAFALRPCSAEASAKLEKASAPEGVEQAPEDLQSVLSHAEGRSKEAGFSSEEATSKDVIKVLSSHPCVGSYAAVDEIEVSDGRHDNPASVDGGNQQKDSRVTSQFLPLLRSNISAPRKVESSPVDEDFGALSSKRDPSPTTLNSADCADRKKPRVSYKDLWFATSILDNVVEEEHHRSPEKKPRLSMSPKCKQKRLEPLILAGDTGGGLDNTCGDALSDHAAPCLASPCKDVTQGNTRLDNLSKLQTQQSHDVLPCLSGASEVAAAKLESSNPLGDVLRTPLAAINGRPDSAVKTKVRPWSYSTSMFSPGDEFWNEAIQVVDDLLAPKEGGSSEICQDPQKRAGGEQSSGKITTTKCTLGGAESKQSHAGVRGDGETYSSEAAGECIGLKVGGLENLCNGIPKVHLELESPLPVRHFNFDSQGSPAEEQNETSDTCQMDITPKTRVQPHQAQTQKNGTICRLSVSEMMERESGLKYVKDADVQDQVLSNPRVAEVCRPSRQTEMCPDIAKVSEDLLHFSVTALQDTDKHVRTDITGSELPAHPSEGAIVQGHTPLVLTSFGGAGLSFKQALNLTHWLPETVAAVYNKKGVTRLYPWQVECLTLGGVLEGKNVVYSASTSAGKSLVAEVLMIRRIISTEKKVILVLPYVALCSEKAEHLEALLEPLGKRVRSFFGTQGSTSFPNDTSIAVCTIEKANVLINKLLEEERMGEIAITVIDELHMVGDADRGYLLELMLTKLRYAAGEGEVPEVTGGQSGLPDCSPSARSQGAGLQIVGMSATIANLPAVASWLKAAMYETQFRPVPLEEFIKVGPVIYNKKMEVVRTIRKGADLGGKDGDHVVEMCNEVVRDGHSVLVFCSSRKACEHSARHIAKFLAFSQKKQLDGAIDAQAVLEGLRKSPVGLCEILAETLPRGVAYHHAGLTMEEREAVEGCFKLGIVKVLTATSTLAAGVNLPARRVILRQPRVGLEYLDATRYRQMTGRAGRAGLDTKGESVIICKPDEAKRMSAMMEQGCLPLCSCLAEDKNGMVRALLEVVASGIVQTANDVHRYVKCTLLSSTQPFKDVVRSAKDALKWLCHQRLLAWDGNAQVYNTTPLGRAAFGSSLTPEESLVVFEDLAKAREAFVLTSDLHLVYQVTPIYIELEPDWSLFHRRFIELSQIEQAVGNRVGVTEPFLMRMAHGGAAGVHMRTRTTGNSRSPKSRNTARPTVPRQAPRGSPLGGQITLDQTLRVCRRFYVALMLSRLVQEVPLNEICDAYKVPRGTVQGLQERAGRFAGMVTAFCERLGWHDLEGLVSKFQNRVSFGVRSEIVELTEIPFVKAARARALYKAGYRTVQAVAEATIPELAKVLSDSSTWAGQDTARQHVQQGIQFGMAKKIKLGARRIVLDKAEEARIAAFSACRALGVDVPALGVPLPNVAAKSSTPVNETKHEQLSGDPSKEKVFEERQTLSVKVSEQGLSDLMLQNGVRDPAKEVKDVATLQGERYLAGSKPMQETRKNTTGSATMQVLDTVSVEKSKATGFDHVALFGGFDREGCGQFSEPEHINQDFISIGPVDVDKMAGGFDKFVSMWQAVKEFAFDLHLTKSKDNLTGLYETEGIAVCWRSSPIYYVNFLKRSVSEGELPHWNQKTEAQVIEDRWKKVGSILGGHNSRKISWDLKFQMQALGNAGFSIPLPNLKPDSLLSRKVEETELRCLPSIELCQPYVDVRIAAWLLWPDEMSNHNVTLEQVVRKRLPGEVAAAVGRASRWINQMGRAAHNGCCRRAAQICEMHMALWKLLVTEGLHEPFLHLEMPLVQVLVGMESCGICIDMDDCRQMLELLKKKLKDLESAAHALAGMDFCLSAPADVAHVLYKHLKLPVPPSCNKGKLHPSTDKQALDYLRNQHPISDVIREHRTVSKLLHGTVGSIISYAQPHFKWTEGHQGKRLHKITGRWLHTSTATGRLAMEEPNLQCVEHAISFDFNGGNSSVNKFLNSGKLEVNVRDIFVPSQEKWVFMSADYSQIELRLMAHFSGDVSMTSLLSEPSGDLFRQIAAQWTGLTEHHVTDKRREQTKRLVYGILYGMGVNALAEQLDCSVAEATDNTERFKSAFPGVTSWLQEAVERCRNVGYITTLGGRKRFLEKISTGNRGEQAKAERQAVNSICQGSAADLIKIAMTKVHSAISRKCDCPIELPTGSASHAEGCLGLYGRCRLLLQIHDELVLEVDSKFVKEAAALVRSSMQGAASLNVPLLVKIRTGKSWGSLQPYDEANSHF